MVAKVLDVASHAVTIEIRRMGGAFGGKETQGNLFACVAALVAKRTGRAAKARRRDGTADCPGIGPWGRLDWRIGGGAAHGETEEEISGNG